MWVCEESVVVATIITDSSPTRSCSVSRFSGRETSIRIPSETLKNVLDHRINIHVRLASRIKLDNLFQSIFKAVRVSSYTFEATSSRMLSRRVTGFTGFAASILKKRFSQLSSSHLTLDQLEDRRGVSNHHATVVVVPICT